MLPRSVRRRLAAPAALAALVACAPAASAAPPAPAVVLPGDAAAANVRAERATWIVGARLDGRSARIARRFGARHIASGSWLVARGRARALAAALRRAGLLLFAEPNAYRQRAQTPPDPLSPQARWRDAVVDGAPAPPAVTPESPLLALVDSQLDPAHPEFAGGQVSTLGGQPLSNEHGTATAAVASAPANGVGILGVWPGARTLNVPLPDAITCDESARGIRAAVQAGAAVVNMSYGSPQFCYAEYVELQVATARRLTLVAAAGNAFIEGNPLEFPASLPHVLTVAALKSDFVTSADESSASEAVDLSAPGVGILTAVPAQFDRDGLTDGYTAIDGTSFAAPMVAGAAAWVRAARPDLTNDQVANVLRLSAHDIERAGWDPLTGFGRLSVARALTYEEPPVDPYEPNDDMQWIDGRAFGRADPVIWRGGKRKSFFALVETFEDPDDVYRISFPPRSRVRVTVRPRNNGDPALSAYDGRADSVTDEDELIGTSSRRGRRTESLTLRNTSRRSRVGYVRVTLDRGAGGIATYTLSVTRLKR